MSIGEQAIQETPKMRWYKARNGFQAPILATITLAPAQVEDYVEAICAKWYSRKRGPRWTSAKSNKVKYLLGKGVSSRVEIDVVAVAIKDLRMENISNICLGDIYRGAVYHGLSILPSQAILELSLALSNTVGLVYLATELVSSPHGAQHIFFLDSGRRGWSVGSKYASYVERLDWSGSHMIFACPYQEE